MTAPRELVLLPVPYRVAWTSARAGSERPHLVHEAGDRWIPVEFETADGAQAFVDARNAERAARRGRGGRVYVVVAPEAGR